MQFVLTTDAADPGRRRALAEVAWRAFHELESREIPEPELRRWLAESFADDPEWGGRRGRRAVDDFLKLVRERTGLLIDAGGDRYQFAHLSLHEYLVARHVLERFGEEQAARVLRHYLHASQWEQALQLLVAGAPEARAEALVRELDPSPGLSQAVRRLQDSYRQHQSDRREHCESGQTSVLRLI